MGRYWRPTGTPIFRRLLQQPPAGRVIPFREKPGRELSDHVSLNHGPPGGERRTTRLLDIPQETTVLFDKEACNSASDRGPPDGDPPDRGLPDREPPGTMGRRTARSLEFFKIRRYFLTESVVRKCDMVGHVTLRERFLF